MIRYGIKDKLPFSHEWVKDTVTSLTAKIDLCGGWPTEAKALLFYHDDKRECVFCEEIKNTGFWTTVLTADEYYWEKISTFTKEKIKNTCIENFKLRIARLI